MLEADLQDRDPSACNKTAHLFWVSNEIEALPNGVGRRIGRSDTNLRRLYIVKISNCAAYQLGEATLVQQVRYLRGRAKVSYPSGLLLVGRLKYSSSGGGCHLLGDDTLQYDEAIVVKLQLLGLRQLDAFQWRPSFGIDNSWNTGHTAADGPSSTSVTSVSPAMPMSANDMNDTEKSLTVRDLSCRLLRLHLCNKVLHSVPLVPNVGKCVLAPRMRVVASLPRVVPNKRLRSIANAHAVPT